jgi:hypothetical protein
VERREKKERSAHLTERSLYYSFLVVSLLVVLMLSFLPAQPQGVTHDSKTMLVHSNPIQMQTLSKGKHAYSLSSRVSIRWPPEDPYENTDTTVLSVNNFFVDLRVEKDTKKLDWAIAGVRIVDQNDSSR